MFTSYKSCHFGKARMYIRIRYISKIYIIKTLKNLEAIRKYQPWKNVSHMKKMTEVDELDVNPLFRALQVSTVFQ